MRTRAAVLIGREAELATAQSRLRESIHGSGPASFLIGEPGVGKSRLIAELNARAQADGLVVARGRASSAGPVSPLRPFAEALASIHRRGRLPDDPLGGYRPLLARVLPHLSGPARLGLREVSPLVAFAEAVLRLLMVLGRQAQGCLLILEDLHDADPDSLAVLDYLLDNVDGSPVALLGALRDEPSDAQDLLAAAERRGAAELLPVLALDRKHTGLLVGCCLGADQVPVQLIELAWRNTAGNPLAVEELLYNLIGGGQLRQQEGRWQLATDPVLAPPPSMLQLVDTRMRRLGQVARRVSVTAAVYGEQFPLLTILAAVESAEAEFLEALGVLVANQLAIAEGPGRYRFHHPLTHAAVLSLTSTAERRQAASRLAEVVLAEDPERTQETCRLAARLLVDAGQFPAAVDLYSLAGGQALRKGAMELAVADLSEAARLIPRHRWSSELIGDLVEALRGIGHLDQAVALVDTLDPPSTGPDSEWRAQIHLDLAWGCIENWQIEKAQLQLVHAQALATGSDSRALKVNCDAIEAFLQAASPGAAYQQAQHAITVAEAAERCRAAGAACRAWSAATIWLERHHRYQEAAHCRQRIIVLADLHGLPGWKLTAMHHAATNSWITDGDGLPLRAVRDFAEKLGAVPVAVLLDAKLAVHEVMTARGSLAPVALALTGRVDQARRLNQVGALRWALAGLVMIACFRANRTELAEALARYEAAGGSRLPLGQLFIGTASAVCLALEGQDDAALSSLQELARRQLVGEHQHSTPHGLTLLLATLAGTAEPGEVSAAIADRREIRWSRQFLHWAAAVQAGRCGDPQAAARHAAQAEAAAAVYPLARHLAARLVASAAVADGWGTPIEDLRAAEAWFHEQDVPVAARTCRDLLRCLGAPVWQRRDGSAGIPSELRAAGITAREYEVGLLIGEHLGNRVIGERLHISPRTVEKHVAALLAKLAVPDRRALIDRMRV